MDWFRWHHGTVNDPKFRLVAKKAGASVAEALSIWAVLLEEASQADDRGCFGNPDFEAWDCAMGLDDGKSERIYREFCARGMVDDEGNRLSRWESRQPKREREDNTGAERQARHRAKAKEVTPSNASYITGNGTVTQSNAESPQKTPRGEERRLEEKNTHTAPPPVDNCGPVDNQDPVCVVLEKEGIRHLNPLDPEFARLKSEGADIGLWTQAAMIAFDGGNPRFDYVLGIVRKKLADRAAPRQPPPSQPITTPGPSGPDPALLKIEQDDKITKPMPIEIRRDIQRRREGWKRQSNGKGAVNAAK